MSFGLVVMSTPQVCVLDKVWILSSGGRRWVEVGVEEMGVYVTS
jgi:hypothetical protein